MAKPKDQIKIPGTFISMIGRHSLWCAPDHLLSISNRGYTEEYRRFYYHEIQALYFRKSATGTVINFILGALALFFAATAAYNWSLHSIWAPIVAEIFGFFLILLLINLYRGATCSFYIRTAVNVQKLSSLGRIRKARKALSILQPRIEAAQGSMQENQLDSLAPAGSTISNRPEIASSSKPVVHEEGKVHAALYVSLIVYGLALLLSLRTYGVVMPVIMIMLFFLLVLFNILSAVRQQNSDLTSGIKRTVYYTFAFIAFRFLASYGLAFYESGLLCFPEAQRF
jgi:uncharacterized membrane protein